MALFELLDALGTLDALRLRPVTGAVAGIATGTLVYYFAGPEPSSAAIAFVLGVAGLFAGIVWELSYRRRREQR